MKILVAGQSGLRKAESIEKRMVPFFLSNDDAYLSAQKNNDPLLCAKIESRYAKILDIEKTISEATFANSTFDRYREVWLRAFDKMYGDWKQAEKENYQLYFLNTKLSWQTKSHFFLPMGWTYWNKDLQSNQKVLYNFISEEFKPDIIITLIDDVHEIQKRLNGENTFRLAELLQWRNVEVMAADMLSESIFHKYQRSLEYPFENSPIFSTRQPLSSLYNYIFRKNCPRVYLSFPISRPRKLLSIGDGSFVDQINKFRSFFRERVTAFDPLTIDERPLQVAAEREERNCESEDKKIREELLVKIKKCYKSDEFADDKAYVERAISQARWSRTVKVEEKLNLTSNERWPTAWQDIIGPGNHDGDLELNYSEIQEIVPEVASQIKSRDFRLIDQSDCVIAFRPTAGSNDWSGGTRSECARAQRTGKSIFVICEEQDSNPAGSGPFDEDIPPQNVFKFSSKIDGSLDMVLSQAYEKALLVAEDHIKKGLRG